MDESLTDTVLVLLGPTGSGKTGLVANLDPERYEIISCDSRQVYRELEIGSAAPDAATRERIRHHLIGFLDPTERIDAARFRQDALAAIDEIHQRGRVPVVCGGSGFYYRALTTAMFPVEVPPAVRESVRAMLPADRIALLAELDPAALRTAAAPAGSVAGPPEGGVQIHPNDAYRVARALEISLASGRPWSRFWLEAREHPRPPTHRFVGFRLEVDPALHWRALEERAGQMVRDGLIAEAGRVFERYGDCPGLATLGYDAALAAYRGLINEAELVERLFVGHRQYAKRQRAWLRRETSLQTVSPVEFPAAFAVVSGAAATCQT